MHLFFIWWGQIWPGCLALTVVPPPADSLEMWADKQQFTLQRKPLSKTSQHPAAAKAGKTTICLSSLSLDHSSFTDKKEN
jgi:hypothetical protein